MGKKAKESAALQRARKKLEKKFQEQNLLVSEKALIQMKKAMHTWLTRHSRERVPLEDKSIALFDSNKHSAKSKSRFVADLLEKVKKETQKSHQVEKLAGRVTHKIS